VTSLDISDTDIGSAAPSVASLIENSGLSALSVSKNRFSAEGFAAVLHKAAASTTLRGLDVSYTLPHSTLRALAGTDQVFPCMCIVVYVSAVVQCITVQPLPAPNPTLTRAPPAPAHTRTRTNPLPTQPHSCAYFGPVHAPLITPPLLLPLPQADTGTCNALRELGASTALQNINLAGNRLGDVGVVALCEGLAGNGVLLSLDLQYSGVGVEGGALRYSGQRRR
jgi:Leucine Rich Repeat (LRR) protein